MHNRHPTSPSSPYSNKLAIMEAANAELQAQEEAKYSSSSTALTDPTSSSLFAVQKATLDARKLDVRKAKNSIEYKALHDLFQISTEFENRCKPTLIKIDRVIELSKGTPKEEWTREIKDAISDRAEFDKISTQLRNAIFRIERPHITTFLDVEDQKSDDIEAQTAHLKCYADFLNHFNQLVKTDSELSRALKAADTILALEAADKASARLEAADKVLARIPLEFNLVKRCNEILQEYAEKKKTLHSATQKRP